VQASSTSSKPHYLILDGLRGVAAELVAVFHIVEAHYPVLVEHPIHHGYLAVDFFFLLSGFVVGYAYDDRWHQMGVWHFFKVRLVRLHPMVVFAVMLGTLGFIVDPFTNGMSHHSFAYLMLSMVVALTLLPSPDVRGWGETHSLVGPCWSLLQEYIGNVIYAVWIRKASKRLLWMVVLTCAAALLAMAHYRNDVATGWSYQSFGFAVVRMMFPFFAGLLLYRSKKMLKIPFAFGVSTLLLLAIFFMPVFKYNGLFEAACIIIAFPLVVLIGASGTVGKFTKRTCTFLGSISYPIYIIHYPFMYLYIAWIAKDQPTAKEYLPIAIPLALFFIGFAYLVFKLYDEPVRIWLKKKLL